MSMARRGAVIAALLYLGLAVYAYRAVLADPSTRLPVPERHEKENLQQTYWADQSYVVGTVAANARALLLSPGAAAPCAPMARPHTLGEHMFAEGLLGALPWLATHDPILTFNLVVVASVWLSAMSMYALAFYWTGSVPAALIAGLLYGFHPSRIGNPAHLYAFANQWTAFALLAAHQLFTRERWRDALLLLLFLCLQLLESFYTLIGLAVVGGVYGLTLLVRYRDRVLRLLPKLAVVAAGSALVAWLVLGPYLEAREVWGVLEGRARLLLPASAYLPGGHASVGWIGLILSVLGLLDRARGPRPRDGEDPRLAILAGGFLLFWCSVWSIGVTGTELKLPSPLVALGHYVPGIDAVRALPMLQFGVFLVIAFFAAYGVLAVSERLAALGRAVLGAALAIVVLSEIFHPALVELSYRASADLAYREARPLPGELALLERVPQGAVLDLPLDFGPKARVKTMPGYILASGYHGQPMAACYNSFLTPLQNEIQRLAERLPDPRAADALAALGFKSLILHGTAFDKADSVRIAPLMRDEARIERLDHTTQTHLVRLTSPLPVMESFAALEGAPIPADESTISGPSDSLQFFFTAKDGAVFRHPDPIEPSPLVFTWRNAAGESVATSRSRGLLPPALAPGASEPHRFTIEVPVPPGSYDVALAREAEPDRPLAARHVTVR